MAALDPSKMNPMEKLKYLGLVNKICQELDNHIGVSDKTLAEFIIALATEHKELPAFRAALEENGAEFPAPFASQLLNLVEKMMPKPKAAPAWCRRLVGKAAAASEKFSGLAVPNTSDERRKQLERDALGGDAVVNPEAEQLKRGATGGKAPMAPPPPPRPRWQQARARAARGPSARRYACARPRLPRQGVKRARFWLLRPAGECPRPRGGPGARQPDWRARRWQGA